MTIITKEIVLERLEAAVAETSVHHTAECVYIRHGEPVCIAGVALFPFLGVEGLKKLQDCFGSFFAYFRREEGEKMFERLTGVKITPEAFVVLERAQSIQDDGETWGRALEAAKDVAERQGT